MPIEYQEIQPFNERVEFEDRKLDTNLHFLIYIFRKIKKGFSPLILICGEQRVGKSFVGIYIANIHAHLMNKEFNPETNTFYDPEMAIARLKDLNNETLFVDEAGDIINKKEWYKKSTIALNSVIQTQGLKNNLYIFVTPFASDVDKSFQKHFNVIIRVDDRGMFKAFRIIKKYDEFKEDKSYRRFFMDDVYIKLCHVPGDLWERYEKFSKEKKEELRQIAEKKTAKVEKKKDFMDIFRRKML